MPDAIEPAVAAILQPDAPDPNAVPADWNGQDQEAHFQSALAAALKEAPLQPNDEVAVQIQEAADQDALKAKEADAVVKDPEAKPPVVDDKADEAKNAGTLGKARRLWAEGNVNEALKLALGVDFEKVEPTTKQWKAIKYHAQEREQAAAAVEAEAHQKQEEAKYVVQQLQPFITGAQAYLRGDFETFLKLTTGDTAEAFQRKLIGQLHEAPRVDPATQARLDRLERERETERQSYAAEQERIKNENAQLKYEQSVLAWKGSIVNELKETGSSFAKVALKPAFIDKVFALQEQNYNPKTRTTIDTIEAAEMVWEELYGDVVETPSVPAGGQSGSNLAPGVKGDATARAGSSTAGKTTTTLRHTQATEAAPDSLNTPWSRENQDKILEAAIRRAKSELGVSA